MAHFRILIHLIIAYILLKIYHTKEKSDENNRNLMELNDYIKNYSDITFNEYKQFKLSKQRQQS